MQTDAQTVSVQLLNETLSIAASHGSDVSAILRRVGMEKENISSPNSRISSDEYGKIWVAIADDLDDEYFGEDPHPMRRGSFALMANAALGAINGEQALERAVRFMRLVLDNIEGRIVKNSENVRLEMMYRHTKPTMFAYATYFILIYGLICWLVGRRIPVIRTVLDCDVPTAVDEYRLIFSEDMVFSADTTHVDLSAEFLNLPIVQSTKTIESFLQNAPGNFVTKYRRSNSLAGRITQILETSNVTSWPDADKLARTLRQAPATMRRKLRAEGVSYQSVKDHTRCRLATELLRNTDNSVLDVALAVGYAEPSAFHRAFLKWMGITPGKYRAEAVKKKEAPQECRKHDL
ncbi:AraC family transcriptional regulator [Paraburkholderia sp. Cy-641]|uniref:AraC family transcriptional regulator n=1 Tax=Paraburkholderia sp. Cy-641 TaxID=2608337 RepID=UPI00141F41EC|nr:AraC family transcriptional regulator [Paraburkholderia sp. Cy-641]NIF80475.1 AraC family transcriptional regulator [Paraburkholderia sp. Cy-641]